MRFLLILAKGSQMRYIERTHRPEATLISTPMLIRNTPKPRASSRAGADYDGR